MRDFVIIERKNVYIVGIIFLGLEAWVMREKRVVPAGVIGRCRTQKTRCHL